MANLNTSMACKLQNQSLNFSTPISIPNKIVIFLHHQPLQNDNPLPPISAHNKWTNWDRKKEGPKSPSILSFHLEFDFGDNGGNVGVCGELLTVSDTAYMTTDYAGDAAQKTRE